MNFRGRKDAAKGRVLQEPFWDLDPNVEQKEWLEKLSLRRSGPVTKWRRSGQST